MSVGFDPNLLLGFYGSRLAQSSAATAHANSATPTATHKGATAHDVTPWSIRPPDQSAMDAKILSMTNFLDTSKVPLSGSSTDAKTEQDNQKLFALYTGFNNLAYLTKMAQRDDMSTGQLAGLDTRFQAGLKQITDFIDTTDFNNFKLQAVEPSSSVVSSASVPLGGFDYATKTLVTNAKLSTALPGLSTSDSFTINVKKGSTT
ncbi:MAG: hypothetical protein JO348_15530, partial [Alphaproteobacteria bacterium]|nr:hypothetical protein [Alphaproteobacteria bacterium]